MTSPAPPRAPAGDESPPLYATFPRRLNALSIDALILMTFSVVLFLLLPEGSEHSATRLTLAFVWWGVLLLYEPVMVAWFGGTMGHRLQNLRVVDDSHGGNPHLGKALGRYLLKGILGTVSFFSMSFSRRHQALHDMMTRSTVQIRDPSKAAPHHYVPGKGEDDQPRKLP